MNNLLTVHAEDQHLLQVFRALPEESPLGSVIVLQEIFGVNPHIRDVCAQFAAHGYAAFAPFLFDRAGGNVELDYDESAVIEGRKLAARLDFDSALKDVAATARIAAQFGSVATVGYCWGGTLAWLSATRLALPSVSYYGARSQPYLAESPQAPVLMHFGERDALIPPEFIAELRALHPDLPLFTYPAGHGFNCNQRADFHAESAALAWRRTLAFLREHVLAPHTDFSLHPRLAQDTIEVGDLPLCRVLLMNDARFPWIILVPRVPEAREIIDLDPTQRQPLMEEIALASTAMKTVFVPEKLNIGAIGNLVPQLHIHLIARYSNDSAWPGTVWNSGTAESYGAGQIHANVRILRNALQLS